MDPVFEFEKRRNTPVRYNRDLFVQTVGSMKRLSEIRDARQKRFWENRVKQSAIQHEQADLKELERTTHLVTDPQVKEAITLKLSRRMDVDN